MSNAHLRVIGSLDNIIVKEVPIADPVFFTKEQIKIGTILRYYGRHAPNTTWEVTDIWHFPLIRGQYRRHKVSSVQSFRDDICITCKESGQHLEMTFAYLSYSAIWRI